MIRTQVYLTAEQREALQELARRTGRTRSALIRQSVDDFLCKFKSLDIQKRRAMLERACGIWKDRDDLPDFQALRRELDRRIETISKPNGQKAERLEGQGDG